MRTALKYYVQRASVVDAEPGSRPPIIGRGFYFFVVKAKNEQEHVYGVCSFEHFLEVYGVHCNGFGDGSWEDNKARGSTKDFMWLDIPIHSFDEKERVEKLYRFWKE